MSISVVHTNHVDILLADYVQDVLNKEDKASVQAHLQQCAVCRAELDRIKDVLGAVKRAGTPDVARSYFSSVLPRVRQRLDDQKHFAWMDNPLVNKLALPLGVAIIVAFVVGHVRLRVNSPETMNPLLAVVDSATTEDIAQIVRDDIPSQDLSSFNTMVISHALTDDQYVQRRLVEEALASDATSPFDVFAGVSPQQALNGFSDSETDEMLQRLGHMETL